MYSLRNRDLTSLVGGVEASEAAKPEPWFDKKGSSTPSGRSKKLKTQAAQAAPGHAQIYGRKQLPHTARDRARPGSASLASEVTLTAKSEISERKPSDPSGASAQVGAAVRTEQELEAKFQELTQAYKELKIRFDSRGSEMSKLHERIRKLERRMPGVAKDTSHNTKTLLSCRQPCCIPLVRLEKAGLNVETVQDLDAKWAGYVFSILSTQARSSGRTLYEIFRKYTDAHARIDESAFRNMIRQFIPSMPEERLTRLFFFADTDGSGMLNFLEFLRLFGVDVDGKMGEEYFEHVMVRMRNAVAKAGGLVALLKLNDKYLNRVYPSNKLIDAIGPVAPSLTRAEICEATARFVTSGELNLSEFQNAMELCASSAFVCEDWVHTLFKSVSSAIQKEHKDLKSILKVLGQGGPVSREDLRSFLHQFQPNLCDSHIDRVYGFLCASCPSGAGNLTVGHLVETVCRPTLGPVQVGSNRARLPLEETSRLAVQLSQLCGSLHDAFDNLNPCLLYDEFCTSLQSLGFSSAFDFEKIFAVIDVQRSGRIPKSVFISVLERFVQSTDPEKDANKDHGLRSSTSLTGKGPEGDKLVEDMDERLQYFRERLHTRRQNGKTERNGIPSALHEELLWEFQRAVNRLLVLESELQYRQKQETRGDIHLKRGLIDQVRDLEAAQARLTAEKRPAAGESTQESLQNLDESKIAEAWHAGYKEASDASSSEIAKLQKELDIAKQEKIHLQLALSQKEEHAEAASAGHMLEWHAPADEPHEGDSGNERAEGEDRPNSPASDMRGAHEARSSSSKPRVQFRHSIAGPGGNFEKMTEAKAMGRYERHDEAEGAITDALRLYTRKRDVAQFASLVTGTSIAGRFIVKEVLAVEDASIVLACGDAFNMRDVTVKVLARDGPRTRANFLRECCIYSVLSEVAEVQNVIHFPGLTSGLAYCVMERLQGRLLSQHLQRIREGQEAHLLGHAAADICDAMLRGLEACHARGVTHLDLKPSAIWEVAQPAGVVVKILDFGLARLANLGVLPADARPFFRPAVGGASSDDISKHLQFDHASASGQKLPIPPPKTFDAVEMWAPFAPFAYLSGFGSCWYMSPARWCGFAASSKHANSAQPEQRLCNVPAGNLWQERDKTVDKLGVSRVTPASPAVQGASVTMQVPDGFYFEVQIRKVWPTAMLPPGTDLAVGPALGFTRLPPVNGYSALNAKAKEWPLSWVIGYDGRFYRDGVEVVQPTLNSAPFAVQEFRRHRDAKLAAAGSGEAEIDWPTGPLGWSFVELLRDDVVGLFAKKSGELVVYVNGRVVSRVVTEGFDTGCPLYPLLEVCGVARDVAFMCSPPGPGSEEDQEDRLRKVDKLVSTVESLATRSSSSTSDVYAAALIAQQVFQSHILPQVPPSFVNLLIATQLWLEQGRPNISGHNGMLIALSDWALTVQEQPQVFGQHISPEIQEVLERVFQSSSLQAESRAIRTAEEFRAALSEKTACSHVPPEFLRSHVQQPAPAKRRWGLPGLSGLPAGGEVPEDGTFLWDLTPWTLSSSHVRRVMVVLQSQDGLRISSVNIGKLEANIPDQLLLHFAECFEGPSGRNASFERRALPRLLFRDSPLPSETCPVSLANLLEANILVLLFHFVQRVHLQENPSSPFAGTFTGLSAARMIGSSLRENWALEELKANNLGFEDAGLDCISEALTHGCRLRRLELRQNRITSAGVQVLAQALTNPGCALQHLELQGNDVGCAGCTCLAEMLKGNNSLEYLGLQQNNIGVNGAVSLGTALVANSRLEELDLGRNVVGVAGCGALVAATRSNSCLQKLNLQDNQLEILAGTTLAEELSAGLQMDLDGLLDSVLPRQSLAKRSSAKFNLAEGPSGSQLVSLNLRHNDLGSIGGAAVVTALQVTRTQLSELNLAWNGLGLEAAAALSNLLGPHSLCILTKLDLRDNRGLGASAVLPKALHRAACSENKDQSERKASKEERRELPQHLRRESAQHLRWLNLANIDLDSEGASLLAPVMVMFSNLEELYLYHNEGLGCAPRMIDLENWEAKEQKPKAERAGGKGILRLARALPQSLKKLALGSCALGPRVVTEMLPILSGLPLLEHLGLCDNDLNEDGDQQRTLLYTAICKLLQSGASVFKRLDLSLNDLHDECAIAILVVLAKEQREIRIDFGANKVSAELREVVHGLRPHARKDQRQVPEHLLPQDLLHSPSWVWDCLRI